MDIRHIQSTRTSSISSIIAAIAAVLVTFSISGIANALTFTEELANPNHTFVYTRADLDKIFRDIVIAEDHAGGDDLLSLLPHATAMLGLRTIDGYHNNLIFGQEGFGSSDLIFPTVLEQNFLTPPVALVDFDGPGPAPPTPFQASYDSGRGDPNGGLVIDAAPRIISQLITNQTNINPAALDAFASNEGSEILPGTSLAGNDQFLIPNDAPDEGLSAPFNAFLTFFGQFFDHGLDLINKGGDGDVIMPLEADDPLIGLVPPGAPPIMTMTRATQTILPGADGILGTDDDERRHVNATTPFVDQNQTYGSHPAVNVFLREYELRNGVPEATGRLINGYGADLAPGGNDDGGMARWRDVKRQASEKLGILLVDADGFNFPLLAVDPYGNFIPGSNGFPQLIISGAEPNAHQSGPVVCGGTIVCQEGNLANPVDGSLAVRTNQNQLIDVSHTANPGGGLTADNDGASENTPAGISAIDPVTKRPGLPAGENPGPPNLFYDNELLDAHFICGDGRCNENIALTTVHTIFHSEHNRLAEFVKGLVMQQANTDNDVDYLNEWLDTTVVSLPPANTDLDALDWNGNRVFSAAKFGTEMQYNRIVFDEFTPTLSGLKDVFEGGPFGYHTDLDASITAEFSQVVYRFGHSLLTEFVDRFTPDFADESLTLIEAFLNPTQFDSEGTLTSEEAAGNIVRGLTRTRANELDEFVTPALQSNLLGLPLDLAAINIARARDVGVPSLNAARKLFFAATASTQLKPYGSWMDFADNLRHESSITNFIAAYGTHPSIPDTGYDAKRIAAQALIDASIAGPGDERDFLYSHGAYANLPDTDANYNGVTGNTTGIDDIDFWPGGLAEERQPFGGYLGSTMNYIFETQVETLQNGDRFYYVGRTASIPLFNELESNSFTALAMRNTNLGDAESGSLPLNIFAHMHHILEVDQTQQYNQDQANAAADAVVAAASAASALLTAQDDFAAATAALPGAQTAADATASARMTAQTALAAAIVEVSVINAATVAGAVEALDQATADEVLADAQALAAADEANSAQIAEDAAIAAAAVTATSGAGNTALANAARDQAQTAADNAAAAADQAQALEDSLSLTALLIDTIGPVANNGRVRQNITINPAIHSAPFTSTPNLSQGCRARGGNIFECRGRNLTPGETVQIFDPNAGPPAAGFGDAQAATIAANDATMIAQDAADVFADAATTAANDEATANDAANALVTSTGATSDAADAAQAAADTAAGVAAGMTIAAQAALDVALANVAATEAEAIAAAEVVIAAQAAFNAADAANTAAQDTLSAAQDGVTNGQANVDTAQNALVEADALAANLSASDDPEGDSALVPLVIRDASLSTSTVCLTDNFIQYTGGDHTTIGGTEGNDTLIGGIGDDSIWGKGGDDCLEGGDGADLIEGGEGNDIITDLAGPDVLEGGPGCDAISSGNEEDVVFGDQGNDFMINSSEFHEMFGGTGNDFLWDGDFIGHTRGGEGDDWMENDGGGEDLFQGDHGAAAEGGEPSHRGHDVALSFGGNNDFDMENGDDIVVDGPGIERAEGQLGYDWISFQNDKFGVDIDLDLTIFTRPILPPSNATIQNRYDRVEGISGSPFSDILRGSTNDPADMTGNELLTENIALITGLDDLVPADARGPVADDIFTGAPQTGYNGGEIIIGGAGSDILVGEGGDDILDGDSMLTVGIDPGNGDPVVPRMKDIQARVFNREISPCDLSISRVITDEDANDTDTDAAVFTGTRADYQIETAANSTVISDANADGFLSVADTRAVGSTGIDLVRNVERLVFSDEVVVLPVGLAGSAGDINSLATGTPDILGNPEVGFTLTADFGSVMDLDNVSVDNPSGLPTGLLQWTWQAESEPGSGSFIALEKLIGVNGNGDPLIVQGETFAVTAEEAGQAIRVELLFQDEAGVFEVVHSAPVTIVCDPNAGCVLPDGVPPIAQFNGTSAQLAAAGVVAENASRAGLARLDFSIPNIPISDFSGTGFDPAETGVPIVAADEVAVANIELTFVTDASQAITGQFNPEIVAIEILGPDGVTPTGEVDQGNVDILFSIRGDDVSPLVNGATTATLRVDGAATAVCTITFLGNSSVDSAIGVVIDMICGGVPVDPELVGAPIANFQGVPGNIDGATATFENASRPGLGRIDVTIPNVDINLFGGTNGLDPAFSAGETAGCGPLPEVCPGDEIAIDAFELVFTQNLTGVTNSFTAEIVAIENLGPDGATPDGTADQGQVNVLFSVRGPDVEPLVLGNTTIEILVDGVVVATRDVTGDSSVNDAQDLLGFDNGVLPNNAPDSGFADQRGRLRIRGTCGGGGGVASAPGLTCTTRANGDYRCQARNLAPGEEIFVTCQ